MANEAINLHKRLAMGASDSTAEASGKAVIQKYAKGGAVMPESRVANLPARGSAPPPLPKPTGKIATMRSGGKAVKKSSGRGR
jgi:hypothetical protein